MTWVGTLSNEGVLPATEVVLSIFFSVLVIPPQVFGIDEIKRPHAMFDRDHSRATTPHFTKTLFRKWGAPRHNLGANFLSAGSIDHSGLMSNGGGIASKSSEKRGISPAPCGRSALCSAAPDPSKKGEPRSTPFAPGQDLDCTLRVRHQTDHVPLLVTDPCNRVD